MIVFQRARESVNTFIKGVRYLDKLYNSKVIIDQKYFIKIADDTFLKYTGVDMYASIDKIIYAEDLERLNRAFADLQIDGLNESTVSIRICNAKEQYVWVRVVVTKELQKSRDDLYCLIISDRKGIATQEQNYTDRLQEYGMYLQLLEAIVLKYEVEEDNIQIFRTEEDGIQYLFQGKLQDCVERLMLPIVSEKGKEALTSLQDNLKSGKDFFQQQIELHNVIREGDEYTCIIKGHTTIEEDGKSCVYGGIQLINGKGTRTILFERASDKDVALNMLNKRAIIEYAHRVMERKEEKRVFFIIVDLDNFKLVNDNYGHMAGDEVLVKVTEIINEGVGNNGKVGRIGGDEFLIVTSGMSEQTELRNMLRTIRTNIEWNYKGKMEGVSLTCSMGVAAYPDNAKSYEDIFAIADKMLYLAKEKGRNRYVIYTPELHQEYVFGPSKQSEVTVQERTYDRIGVLQYVLEDYLIRRISNNTKMFSKVAAAYNLCEILIIYQDFTVAFQWTPQGASSNINEIMWMQPEESFSEAFDQDKLFVADGVYDIEKRIPYMKEMLEKKDIQSALFYKLEKKGKLSGYIMFGKNVRRQKWSEAEIMALSTVAKVFEMAILE